MTIVDKQEGLFGNKDTLQVLGIETQLNITALLRCRRDIEPIEAVYILSYTAAGSIHERSKYTFFIREGHLDDGRHVTEVQNNRC